MFGIKATAYSKIWAHVLGNSFSGVSAKGNHTS